MTMSTRIAVMDAGRILQVGRPHEIYEYPVNRMVADFIGTANFFDGVVEKAEGAVLTVRVHGVEAPLVAEGSLSAGANAVLMVRPEKIVMSREPQPGALNQLRGKVVEIAYLGDVSIYHVRLSSGATVLVTNANLRHSAEPAVTWEDEVVLSWHPGNAVVLP
ncbi:MAG: TOBE domain-containing protein [Rhodospirillaceae bacterium]|nr:TOBE domain-containing protein [Rhodospirillales bacterium]